MSAELVTVGLVLVAAFALGAASAVSFWLGWQLGSRSKRGGD